MNAGESPEGWPVCENYIVRDSVVGKVVVGDKVERRYNPMDAPRLLHNFEKLREGDDKRVLKFVHTWGLLGWPLPGEDMKPPIDGDPLDWIWEQAGYIRLALRLYHHLKRGEHDELEWLLGPYRSQAGAGAQWKLMLPVTNLTGILPPPQIRWGEPASMSRKAIASIVNYGLDDIRQRVEAEPRLHVRRYAPSLIGAIYWHLAETVTKGRVAICQNLHCGIVYTVTHGRLRYCSPSCGAAYRQRRHRQQQRKGG